MPDFNLTIIIGRLTSEPELRYTPNGTACTEFSVAVNRKSGDRQDTLYLGCVAWNKLAENISRYMQKGAAILVRGYLRQESWQNRDGQKRTTIKLICDEVQFLDRRPAANDAPPPPPAPAPAPTNRHSRSEIPDSVYQHAGQKPPQPPAQPAADPHVEEADNINVDDIPF